MPNISGRLPSSQSQGTPNSAICTPQSILTEESTTLSSTTASHNSVPLQSILGSFDASALHSNLLHTVQPVMQQQPGMMSGTEIQQHSTVSTSWIPAAQVTVNQLSPGLQSELIDNTRPLGGACIIPQTDPVVLPNFSTAAMPSPQFGYRDCSHEQDALQSGLHRQMLYGAKADIPSMILQNSMSTGSRAYGSNTEFQNQCVNELMQGQLSDAGINLPLNSSVFNGGLDDGRFPQHVQPLAQTNTPTRTYTKVYKLGSVGRSLDVTRFSNYSELRRELEILFGLEGLLECPRPSGWQLVFIDKEEDWLLLGDDPWEQFVSNVRYIKILSPAEVFQMQEQMTLQSSLPIQRQTSSSSDDGTTQQDSRNPSSVITSNCSLEY